MKSLNHFSIPIQGLKDGMHQFDFQVDKAFFAHFENSQIADGNFNVKLYFDKRPDMYVMTFSYEGTVQTACDRCLADINLPLKGDNQLMVKFAETPSEEAEIIYVQRGLNELNVAKYVYEFIALAVPILKVYDCENDESPPCNEDMLGYLDKNSSQNQEEDDNSSNPVWDKLKDLDNTN